MAGQRRASGAWLRQIQGLFCLGTASGLTDGELLDRFGAGRSDESEAAFEALMQRHGPMVLRVCHGILRDRHDAEDAFQATFLVLSHRAGSIRRQGSLSSWLFGVSQRVAAQARSHALRRGTLERRLAERATEVYTPPEYSEEPEILIEEIDRLPDRLRTVVLLCYLEGLSYDTAAHRLGLSETTIRGRLARARERLRTRLSQRGVTIPAGILTMGAMAQPNAAAISATLTEATIRTVLGVQAGDAVQILAKGVLQSMLLQHVKAAAIIVAATLGSSLIAWQTLAARDGDQTQKPRSPSTANIPTPAPKPQQPPAATPVAAQPETNLKAITIETRDLLTDAPVPEVSIEFWAEGVSLPPSNTDKSGTARFLIPIGVKSVTIKAKRDGYVPLVIQGGNGPSEPMQDTFLFQMEKATEISGRVLDENQQPIAGAMVAINPRKRYPRSAQRVASAFDTTKTDASGRWFFSTVPAKPDAIELSAFDYLCLSDRSSFLGRVFDDLPALHNGSALLHLRRGTLVEGTVVSPSGQPVAGANVFYGEGRRYGNAIPPLTTDAQGKFTLGIAPGIVSTVTSSHPGFGPAQQTIPIGKDPRKITLQLTTPRTLKGRVVDRAGKPIAKASLAVAWAGSGSSAPRGRGEEAIALDLETDANGRFVWNDAPNQGVGAEVYKSGYLSKSTPLSADADNQIVLSPFTTFHGKVIDRDTGQPIPKFTVENAAIWNPGERLVWQRSSSPTMNDEAKKIPGSFEHIFGQTAHRYLVRVFAENYLPTDSDLFEPTESSFDFTFRLEKADPIRGSVLDPDGSPSRDATVYLVPAGDSINLNNGELRSYQHQGSIHAKVSTNGQFALPPQKEDYRLMALTDTGIAIIDRGHFLRDSKIRIQPWAQVAGTVRIGTKPASEIELFLRKVGTDSQPTSARDPWVSINNWVRTDAQGRFHLPRLQPGHYDVVRRVPNGANRISEVKLTSLDVAAGQSLELTISQPTQPGS